MTWAKAGIIAATGAVLYLLFHSLRRKKKKYHANPFVQGVNRLKSHTILGSFESDVEARSHVSQIETSPFVSNLGGIWNFRLFSTVEEALHEVHHSTAASVRDPIHVPGHWQLQGFSDHPIYTNIKYIIPVDPPFVPDKNPTGYYEREFVVAESWVNRKITISFGGVDNAFYIWVNHVFIGFSKDSRVQAEFDLTEVTKFNGATNFIQVVVLRFSDGYYLEDQDMWNLSGIFRDVHLISFPKVVHISDFSWKLDVDGFMHSCDVLIEVELKWDVYTLRLLFEDAEPNDTYLLSRNSPYATSVEGDWMLSGELYEEGVLVSSSMQNGGNFVMHDFTFDASSDSPICSATKYAARPIGPGYQRSFSSWLDKSRTEKLLQNLPPETTSLKLRLNVVSPGLWSAEKPHVYTLVLALRNARENTIVQAESCRLGFRTIEISDGVLRVNQKPIMVRGVNYHEHDPVLGHSISSQLLEADMKLMKRHNFNAVRTSHYPQTAMFYELCTLYGLFVVDEANIETHGMKPYAGRLADSLEWELSFMRRLIRMIRCHRNHACIISWSLGNESGYGRTHDKMASLVRKYEPDRVLMYEPASYGPRESNTPSSWFGLGGGTDRHIKKLATDVLCPMYPRVEDCIIIANRNPDLPVVLCEYAHMMGNSGGNLDVYWKWFNNFSRLQGGFIWDWADQGVSAISLTDLPIWAYGGDFGESYNDGAFCLNGLNWPDRGLGDALTFSRNDCAEARYARLFSRPSASTFREIPDNETLEDRCTSNAIMGNLSYRGFSLPSKVETNFNINFPEYVEQERRKSFKFISGSDVSNMNPNGLTYLDDMKIDRHVYGLQRVVDIVDNSKSDSNSKSKSYVCATSPYRFTTSISIPVDDAVAKPQLLEAKQCMKVFDCEVTSLHPTVWDRHQGHINTADSSRSSGMNSSGNASTASVPNAGKDNMAIGESQSHYPLSITIHYSILNRLNHIKNIEEYLQFDVLLLCDGIIVDRKPMVKRNRHGATNRRHVFDPDDGMTPYMQEVEMLCHFSVSLTRWPVNAIGFEKLNCPPYTNNDKCATQSGENKEGPKIPPLLPLSRCASASIPTNNPSVAPSVYESPSEKIKKSFATEQFATLLRPSIGWTAYGHAWPEDALIATDSFDHLPFNIPKWSSDGEKDGSEIRPRGESTGSNEWIRGPQYIEHVTSIHEANINLQSKRSVNAMKQDYSKLEPSLWSDITPATKWSTVVIGRLVPDTPWAEAGFPLGFAQCNISGKLIYSLLPCTSTTSSKTQFGADSLPPKAPTSSIISSQQSELNPGFYDASNKSSKNLYFEQLVDSSLKSETLMAKDEDENEFGIENFINIDEDHAVKEEIRTNFDASAVKRSGRLRSRSGSWTDPGTATEMSSVAAAVADIFEETNSSPYCSAYNISVLWAPRYNIDFSTEYYRKSMESANILLRAEAVNMHPDDALVYPKSIEITIDGVHGTISSIVCDGQENLLLTEEELLKYGSMHSRPSRFQLHRAPTDNDRMGYLSGWCAAGLDKEFLPSLNNRFVSESGDSTCSVFLPLKKSKVERHNDDIFINDTNSDKVSIERKFNCALRSDSVAEVPAKKRSPLTADLGAEFTPIEGTTELPYMTVVHVQVNSGSKMNHQQSTGLRMSGPSVIDFGGHNACGSCKDGGPLEDFTEAFGVTCKWKMNPSSLNSSRVAILKLVNNFAQDSMQQVLIIEVESNASEAFLHDTAAKLQFGRQSQRPLIQKEIRKPNGTQITVLACRVRLWKPVLYMNSTTVKAEDLNMGPYGGLSQDDDEGDNNDFADATEDHILPPLGTQSAYSVYWEVTYSLSTRGELLVRASLDCQDLPTLIPRVGMSLTLRPTNATSTILWRGLGPHENYPDRVASCVSAVHEAPTASLHTPYIRPSENGSRCGIYWIQLNNGTYKNKVKKEPKKGFNEIKEHALPFGFVNANDTSSLINSEYKISSHVDDMTIDESDKCRGCFITVRSSKLFNFSVQEYSTEALSVASHSAVLNSYKVYANSNSTRAELVNRESPTTLGYGLPSAVTLNIDPFLMGVGGDDSWSACIHEEYTLPPSVYNFKLSMSFHYQ